MSSPSIRPVRWINKKLGAVLVFLCLVGAESAGQTHLQTATVIIGAQASPVEKKVGHLLRDRLAEWPSVDATLQVSDSEPGASAAQMNIYLGKTTTHRLLSEALEQRRIAAPTRTNPGPEGFVIHSHGTQIFAAGTDDRGCLYAVGELLRQLDFTDQGIRVPHIRGLRTAPAFEIRGTQFGQSRVARQLAKVRPWTTEETARVILDYALAGANIFSVDKGPWFDFVKSYGLMTQGRFGANAAPEIDNPSWEASESIGRKGYLCLSVPDAHSYMLEKCENYFRDSPSFDLIKFHGGDGGGCECDRCDPYGLTFIRTVEKMAEIIHKYHPDTRIYFTNQKFDNADDQAIFDYLNEHPRDWLWAWGYGPGSDATTWQPGHRQTHRMDLFTYPGHGPYGLYPREILHQLPPQQQLIFYNEITHWKYSQHGYIQMYPRADKNGDLPPLASHDIYERRPDQAMTMVYNRLTFFAWPRYYHRVFNDLLRYGIGDITHSSGHHDHFNQWMWQRLLWSPRMTVEQVVQEYCRAWFGQDAAKDMAAAIFQLERNLEEIPDTSIAGKSGIPKYYRLVQEAGAKMDPAWRQGNWLYTMYLQKGALDRYVQLAVIQQEQLQASIEEQAQNMLDATWEPEIVRAMLGRIKELQPTSAMLKLQAEADSLGMLSNRLFGMRNDGLYHLTHDFVGLGWTKRQLERCLSANPDQRRELLSMIADYDHPGEGGFYDNLGTGNDCPHVIHGYPYDHGQPYVSNMLSEANRPSQRSMHFTQDEAQGVTLQYDDLSTTAPYRVRFTLVRPWYQARYAERMNQHAQAIYADDRLLDSAVELPLQMSDFFTYDIPPELTADGELTIRLAKAADVAAGDRVSVEQWRNSGGWGTLVSEVWLMKK